MTNSKPSKRVVYLDYLRVIATFAVITLHVCSGLWSNTAVDTVEWSVLNIYNAGVRWGVPIFVMISGVLFCSRAVNIEKLYKKNIFRLLMAFVFWSFLYASINAYYQGFEWESFLSDFLLGEYHLWFLPMIIGVYMVIPFLKKITESQKLMRYFLLLAFIFTFLVPNIILFVDILDPTWGSILLRFNNKFKFHFTLGYVGYFVLGYYLHTKEFHYRNSTLILGLLIGYLLTSGLTQWSTQLLGSPQKGFYNNLSVNVLLVASTIFLLMKKNIGPKQSQGKGFDLIVKISNYSFGIYLVHVMILNTFRSWGIHALMANPVITIPIISLSVYVVGYWISCGIHKIPVLKKYIV